MSTTALHTVPSPVVANRADHAEDLMSDVWRVGRAWTEMAGGYAELHVVCFPGGKFVSRWGSRGGPEATADCFVDAVLELAKLLAKDLRTWAAEIAEEADDLSPMLDVAVSVSIARLETSS